MVSTVLAGVLQSYLGQYLELSGTTISVGSEVSLSNVKLKESALSDLGLPVRCVHGKVQRLVIKIPWFNLFTKKTTIDLEGLHLLLVPSSSVRYDEAKERKEELEAKQKRLERTEQAKQIDAAKEKDKGKDGGGDTFVERLVANIIRNLEVTISRVHVRYEDKQVGGTGRYPFAAGVTLDSVNMTTTAEVDDEGGEDEPDGEGTKVRLKLFHKHVELNSLALYWRPKANLYSEDSSTRDDVIDLMFDTSIGTREHPVSKLKYLLGPISSEASLRWCPNPARFDFAKPEVDLRIVMRELCLSLTKYQYHDFVMLLQSFEFMSRAAKFRKYKARNGLENLPNYSGRLRDLWKYAFDCIYEEEVMRKINNWSWTHMKVHISKCKTYRELYKKKLTTEKLGEQLRKDLRWHEDELDEVNIRIQRQLAEREVEQEEAKRAMNTAAKGGASGFWGWLTGSGGNKEGDGDDGDETSPLGSNIKAFSEALTLDEKSKLYEVLDYQENAHHGIFPKSFEARKLFFDLDCLTITIRDDDLNDATVLLLELDSVKTHVVQRPSADYVQLDMKMKSLSVTGLRRKGAETVPSIVKTRPSSEEDDLVNLTFENNPPFDSDGDLDADEGSLYDQRLKVYSSPLEIIYDAGTFNRLVKIFRTPDDLTLTNLQHSAASKLKEYREVTTLGLQYVIEHHNLIDVDIKLKSSYVILPHGGALTKSCACAVANLGSIRVKSRPISAETRSLREMTLSDLTEVFKANLRDQAYDKFNVSLENMQLIVALPNEEWRTHLDKEKSSLFLLKPTSLKVMVHYCLIKSDPEMPLVKVKGSLDNISVNVSDYRLIKLAQILDSLFDAAEDQPETNLHRTDSDASMMSALSSLANTGSLIQATVTTTLAELAPVRKSDEELDPDADKPTVQVTKFVMDFNIGLVNLSLTQLAPNSNLDQKLFHFTVRQMEASAAVRAFDIVGKFKIGGVACEHLLLKTPSGDSVRIVYTKEGEDKPLLSITYTDANKKSPEFVSVHRSVLKKVEAKVSSVHVNFHQDAVLDLADKIAKFVTEVSSNAKRLLATTAAPAAAQRPPERQVSVVAEDEPDPNVSGDVVLRRQNASKRRLSKSLSVRTAANISRWAFRAKRRRESMHLEEVQFKLVAVLESVTLDFMTSKIYFANLVVRDLEASYCQTERQKVITAKLVDFRVNDPINTLASEGENLTLYERMVESLDEKVFDARVTLFDKTSEEKRRDAHAVDVKVEAQMGRVKVVFLMKFVRDLLDFLEPFSAAKEVVAERANQALEEATRSMIDAYANETRALLDVRMDAPLIIIPVHSTSSTTFMADLGTLTLANRFSIEGGRAFDNMHFLLENLQLFSAKIHDDVDNNDILASCLVIHPITFELDIKRNMNGAKKKQDPAELKVTGTLYEIKLELSKSDYDVVMAILTNNFLEKGSFEVTRENESILNRKEKKDLNLPLKSRRSASGSRTSLLSEQSIQQLQTVLKVPERDPESRAVEFIFKFRGFRADLYSGETPLVEISEKRNKANALARIHVKLLSVKGHVLVSSAVSADAYLENCLLEDNRAHDDENSDGNRIVRLMEAKKVIGDSDEESRTRMIDISYEKDPEGNQKVEVTIYSFVLVGSIPYLMEIANFFVLDQEVKREWGQERQAEEGGAVATAETPSKISVFVEIEEPDIFLVENIEDANTDALMLTTQVQFKFWTAEDNMSMMASLTNVRCHTCRFNPDHREETLAQILQPTTLSFTVSRAQGHGMRINANIADLCLNVSPHGIIIVQKSVQAFLDSMSKKEETAGRKVSVTYDSHTGLWKPRRFDDSEFWFLRPDESLEAVENMNTLSSTTGGKVVITALFMYLRCLDFLKCVNISFFQACRKMSRQSSTSTTWW